MTLRLLSYNIQVGGIGREKAIAAVIQECEPDIVVLQEAVDPEVVKRLASECAMKHWGSTPGYSLGFLSRIEIEHYAWHRVRWARRAYLELVPVDSNFTLFGVHLSGIHSNLTERRRAYELRAVLAGIKPDLHGCHIVIGDFNTLAPGEQLDARRLPPRLRAVLWMTGRTIRWLTIQLMLEAGYVDAYRLFHAEDEGFTFPTWDPHVRLDYAFVPKRYVAILNSCDVVRSVQAASQASDHFPLLADVTAARVRSRVDGDSVDQHPRAQEILE